MSDFNCGIYSISCPEGNKYIGSSSNLKKRWYQHKYFLNKKKHHSRYLQNAWDRFKGNLEFNILLICSPENILLYEQIYLDFYSPIYNVAKFVDKSRFSLGLKRSLETRQKISKALKGKNIKGHSLSEECKIKLSISLRGNKNGIGNKANLGRKLSKQVCEKMSASRKGFKISEEQKQFLSQSRKGINNPMFGKIPWNKGKKKNG